eukprot:31089-Chlamydomonas_euryale.AAC.4
MRAAGCYLPSAVILDPAALHARCAGACMHTPVLVPPRAVPPDQPAFPPSSSLPASQRQLDGK